MIKDMEKDATSYIYGITNSYLKHIGGSLNAENMNKLTANQHTLLAYRIDLKAADQLEARTGMAPMCSTVHLPK